MSGACLTALLLSLWTPGAFAQDPPDNPSVEVDLAGGFFKQVLPFDDDFQVKGDVPATTELVDVRFIGHRGSFRVEETAQDDCAPGDGASGTGQAEIPEPKCFDEQGRAFECDWRPAQQPWKRVIPPAADAKTVEFNVSVPPLEAKHHYAFRFEMQRGLTTAELAEFQVRARKVIDEALRANTEDDPSAADNDRVRRLLVQELRAVACPGLRLKAKSFFDTSVPYDQLSDRDTLSLNTFLGEVLTPQARIRDNIQGRSRIQPSLEERLRLIAENGALDRLIGALRAKAEAGGASSGLLKEFLEQNKDALDLAELGATERANLTLGLAADASGPASRLVQTIDAATVSPFVASYRGTEQRLRELQEWLASLVQGGNRHLLDEVVAGGGDAPPGQRLAAADVAELQTLLGKVDEARRFASALANTVQQVKTNQETRTQGIEALAKAAEVEAADAGVIIHASTLGNFKTQQRWYIAADFGFAYGPDIAKAAPYVGTNIYFRPVNKDVPLSQKGGFMRRFAATVGLTVGSLADADPQTRNDLYKNNSLLLGVGYRVTDSGRLGLGALIFDERDPNPLLTDEEVTYSPYLSLSFDWDILGFFRGLSGVFPNP